MCKYKTNEKNPTILFCPLDWGLGHIARDMPLIREFHTRGHKVIVAASPPLISWLKTELPEVETTIFPGPNISYGRKGFSLPKFILSLPGLLSWLYREQVFTKKLIKKHRPSLIISDNRYGARHKGVFSVIITHQLMIKMPRLLKLLELPLHYLIKSLINKFDEFWIPYFSKTNTLAGDLVHKYKLPSNSRLIGPLSRFEGKEEAKLTEREKDSVLAIISGPEPQKTILEKQLVAVFTKYKEPLVMYNGKLDQPPSIQPGLISINGHCSTNTLKEEILNHGKIITRSGYSTIMDMYTLGKNCLLIPTPGQTEQEYLARFHKNRNHFILEQKKLNQSETGPFNFPAPHSNKQEALIFREELKILFEIKKS